MPNIPPRTAFNSICCGTPRWDKTSSSVLTCPLLTPLARHRCEPDCSICVDGYAASFGFACDKCVDKAGGVVVVVVLVLTILLAAAVIATHTISGQLEGGGRGRIERLTRYIPLQSVKIVIVAWQIVTQVRGVFVRPPTCQHMCLMLARSAFKPLAEVNNREVSLTNAVR